MINGLELFRKKFAQFKEEYVLIGGIACYLHLNQVDIDFRATKDFDIVLLTGSINEGFYRELRTFFEQGGYERRLKSDSSPQYFRFESPKNADYPPMIELFSKKDDIFSKSTFGKIKHTDAVSSLSAILLDRDYYDLLNTEKEVVEDLSVLSVLGLIPFKMKAYLDLAAKKESGQNIDSRKVKKHRNDVFELVRLLSGEERLILSNTIKSDIFDFVATMKKSDELISSRTSKLRILEILEAVYLS